MHGQDEAAAADLTHDKLTSCPRRGRPSKCSADSSSCVTGSTDRILAVYLTSAIHPLPKKHGSESRRVSGCGSTSAPEKSRAQEARRKAGGLCVKEPLRGSATKALSDTGMLSGLASCAAIKSDILTKARKLGDAPTHSLPWPYGGFGVAAEASYQAGTFPPAPSQTSSIGWGRRPTRFSAKTRKLYLQTRKREQAEVGQEVPGPSRQGGM